MRAPSPVKLTLSGADWIHAGLNSRQVELDSLRVLSTEHPGAGCMQIEHGFLCESYPSTTTTTSHLFPALQLLASAIPAHRPPRSCLPPPLPHQPAPPRRWSTSTRSSSASMCCTCSYLRAFAASGAFAALGALSYQAVPRPLLHRQDSARMHGGHRTGDTLPRSSRPHPSTRGNPNGLVENQDGEYGSLRYGITEGWPELQFGGRVLAGRSAERAMHATPCA
ncbi:hypothetical protein C8R44DRAFT_866669 [Mycena epipterygia]|nr:hypothetical protein C8R44DRAFT_866669 [Mycena epipterygia]